MIWYSFEKFRPDQTTELYIARDLYGQPIFGDYAIDLPYVEALRAERIYRYSGALYTKLNSLMTADWADIRIAADDFTNYDIAYGAERFRYMRGYFTYIDNITVTPKKFKNPYFKG